MADRSRAPTLILASASPRRRQLLAYLGIPFQVVPSAVAEEEVGRGEPMALARRLARAKAEEVAGRLPRAVEDSPRRVVLAADTVVAYRGRALGKPQDEAEAAAMLRRLRGRWQRVITALAVVGTDGEIRVAEVVTRVRLRDFSDDEIARYVASGEPLDKAGAYAIQDEDFHPVASYAGCYCNVVGMPLWAVAELLRQVGLALAPRAESLPAACTYCLLAPLRPRLGQGPRSEKESNAYK